MAIKKLNEPKSKQSIEILNFFARHAAKYIHLYRFVCVLRPPSPSSCYAAASDLKIKRIKSKDICSMCVFVCVVCVYFRVYVLCGHCVTPTSTSTSLLPST